MLGDAIDLLPLLRIREEEGSGWVEDDEGSGWMSLVIPVRADLANGDLRVLYLGWRLCAQMQELDEDALEPPVPARLDQLRAPIRAFADFLRSDDDLIAVTADSPLEKVFRASMDVRSLDIDSGFLSKAVLVSLHLLHYDKE